MNASAGLSACAFCTSGTYANSSGTAASGRGRARGGVGVCGGATGEGGECVPRDQIITIGLVSVFDTAPIGISIRFWARSRDQIRYGGSSGTAGDRWGGDVPGAGGSEVGGSRDSERDREGEGDRCRILKSGLGPRQVRGRVDPTPVKGQGGRGEGNEGPGRKGGVKGGMRRGCGG